MHKIYELSFGYNIRKDCVKILSVDQKSKILYENVTTGIET
jgi:hypothetical protein